MKKRIIAATPMICLIIYLCLGFIWGWWHPGWVIFFLIPIVSCILGEKSIRYMYPSFCVLVYLCLGFIWGWWHPGWIIFLTIPVFYTLVPKKKKALKD